MTPTERCPGSGTEPATLYRIVSRGDQIAMGKCRVCEGGWPVTAKAVLRAHIRQVKEVRP